VAGLLSDEAWARICAAAERAPDAGTRERLSTILFEEYPAFHYDRKRVAEAYKRAEQMLKHLNAFAELYRQAFLPCLPVDQLPAILTGRASPVVPKDVRAEPEGTEPKDVRTERDFCSIAALRLRAEDNWLTARAIRRANARRANVQHEWLYDRLCAVWLYDFHAPLTYSVPSRGGPPYGPLIAFILAAAGLVMSEPPSPETVRDAIDRERMERENARQLGFHFRP
jgi:hypothetical protein